MKLEWVVTPKSNSFANSPGGTYFTTGPVTTPSGRLMTGWLLSIGGRRLGTFSTRTKAEQEAQRLEDGGVARDDVVVPPVRVTYTKGQLERKPNPAHRGTLGQYNYRNVPFSVHLTPVRQVWCYDIRAIRNVYPLADAGVLRCESTSCAAAVLSARLHIDRLISTVAAKVVVGATVSVPFDPLYVEFRTPEGERIQARGKIPDTVGPIMQETPKFVVIEFRTGGGARRGPLTYAVVERRYFEKHAKGIQQSVGEPMANPRDRRAVYRSKSGPDQSGFDQVQRMVRAYVDRVHPGYEAGTAIPINDRDRGALWRFYIRPHAGGKSKSIDVPVGEVERVWRDVEKPTENPLPHAVRAGMLVLSMVFMGTGVYFIAKAVDPLMPKEKEQYPVFGQDGPRTWNV